jgi:hypothetical protein|tara:strand:- start:82 stop:378 length:297 start_codon:yes stop_codon:yes gene_type:complete
LETRDTYPSTALSATLTEIGQYPLCANATPPMSRFGGGAPLRSIPEEEASDLPSPKDDVSSTTSFSLPRVFMNPSVRFLTAAAFFEDDLCPAPAELRV